MSSDMAPGQNTVRLTYEVPSDQIEAAMSAMADLATSAQASIELLNITPNRSEVPKRWKDSGEDLYSDITYSGVTDHNRQLRLVTINNLAAFARANGIHETLATTIIGRLGRELDPEDRQRYMFGYFDRIDYSPEEEAYRKAHTGIKVETAPELIDKLKGGKLFVKHLPGSSLSVDMLEAYSEQLFRDPETLASPHNPAKQGLSSSPQVSRASTKQSLPETPGLTYWDFSADWSGNTQVSWKTLARYADNDPSFPLEKIINGEDGSISFVGDIGKAAVWLRRTHPGTVAAAILEKMARDESLADLKAQNRPLCIGPLQTFDK